MSLELLGTIDDVLTSSNNFIIEQETKAQSKEKIKIQLEEIAKDLEEKGKTLEDMIRAATILGNVADENTQRVLTKITSVINSSLAEMFKQDKRKISIKQIMYRNVYPHFVVELETEEGIKRTF